MKKFYLSILTILLALSASAQTTTEAKSLAEIINSGKAGDFYTITDELVGVYVPPRLKNVVFAKDNNNHASKSEPSAAQIASGKIYDHVNDFDQSNWIKILFPNGYDASAYEGKKITNISGRVNVASAPGGPVGLYIDVDGFTYPTIGAASPYAGNLYNCANFVQQDWFFVLPKNIEYANIHWAVYKDKVGDNDMFYVPQISDWPGSFKVDMALWEGQDDAGSVTADQVFTDGEAYEFPAIIRFSTGTEIGVGIDPGFEGDLAPALPPQPSLKVNVGFEGTIPTGYTDVVVYPLRITQEVITAIDEVDATRGEAESVQYYDLQGRMSSTPLKGVNIKVTTYSDGTRETMKIVK